LLREGRVATIFGVMKTVPEVVALLREQIKIGIDHEFDTDPIGNIRLRQLLLMEDCVNAIGFPTHGEHKAKVSLTPYIFQEANYSDISWTSQEAELDHLRAYFELDYMVQNQGRERREATATEFKHYVDEAFKFIDRAQAEKK
jgi:hypothetical protein